MCRDRPIVTEGDEVSLVLSQNWVGVRLGSTGSSVSGSRIHVQIFFSEGSFGFDEVSSRIKLVLGCPYRRFLSRRHVTHAHTRAHTYARTHAYVV